MSVDDGSDIIFLHDDVSYNGDRIAAGTAREVLTRIELDLAYSIEKVLNLELLVMQVADKASDYEILSSGSEELLTESIEKAFQFDILSGYLNSELKEIESFMSSLLLDVIDAFKFTESEDNLEESLSKIEAKLHHAEESLRNSQEQVADIRKQSDNFEKLLALGICTDEDLENGNCSLMNSKWNLQSVEQQRHFLQSLETSLAREMDLEKKLSESRYNEEELKMKLHFAEQDAYCSEDLIEAMMERVLTAENTVDLLLGKSKEFMGKLQNGQFSSTTSTTPEREEKSNMKKGIVKLSAEEADPEKSRTSSFGSDGFPMLSEVDIKTNLKEDEDKCMATISVISTLRARVNVLEEQLRKSQIQLQLAKVSVRESNNQQNILYLEENNMENVIKGLRENVIEVQSRAESAEARCAQLMKANVELNDEIGFLRKNGTEKAYLERMLKESDTELEHAKASVDANEEEKNMLYTEINDMEHLIKNLKAKVSKAENKAEIAEAKCALLTDTNLELKEELSFLRGRLESLEGSCHQADVERAATAKDIGNRTKIFVELVKKLALEREHLQLQMTALIKRNKILTKKCLWSENDLSVNHEKAKNYNDPGNINSYDETLAESVSTNFQHLDGFRMLRR
ncbi:WPP domain-interacting tail-anchored protein 1-like [Dendrobium catenatum]|uniref:WPP domain-interacting tail-anchored protein 1-like n=1 Tax=Dendrobium catenatum TaxID=906689 RepID=UPI0010A0854D|nr:WPP domain-interacting tail-anchored protein 1-like [Dendrobium catenatum]